MTTTVVRDGYSPATVIPVVEARGVSKEFKVRGSLLSRKGTNYLKAVDNVSLALYPGRITALVGESGCGKSTLARLFAQMYTLTDGQILLDGEPVHATKGKPFVRYAKDVQLMLQDPYGSFNPVATIAQHLERTIKVHTPRISREDLRAKCEDLLEQVNLSPAAQFLEKYPHELSGGQLQRCSIARALVADPRVFLADEPVSALDVSIRLGVLNLLKKLTEERDVALLYVTHDIASARYFAQDTAVMYAGQMIEYGPSESVTQSPAHPYTQLLVSSAPDPTTTRAEAIQDLGSPPSLLDPPSGCRFRTRCPFAQDICAQEVPPVSPASPNLSVEQHWVRCWRSVEGAMSPENPGQ